MTKSRSPRAARQADLLSFVARVGTATTADLAERSAVSTMTIHRDIEELASRGLLRKFHGGVSALPTAAFESSSEYRLAANASAKTAIARRAVELIDPGMTIYLDDSSSAHFVAKELVGRGPFTIVTNYLPTLNLLGADADIHLVGIGGDFSNKHAGFGGEAAVDAIRRIRVDMAFMSVSAMTPEMTFHQEQASVQVKRPILEISNRALLLMDASKLDRTALYRVAPTRDYAGVILGPGNDPDFASALAEHTEVLVTVSD